MSSTSFNATTNNNVGFDCFDFRDLMCIGVGCLMLVLMCRVSVLGSWFGFGFENQGVGLMLVIVA